MIGQSKELRAFTSLKPPEFDVIPTFIEPQKFIEHGEKILITLVLKETWYEVCYFPIFRICRVVVNFDSER